jgi:hypothetical protein
LGDRPALHFAISFAKCENGLRHAAPAIKVREGEGKVFFSEEKKQKTFISAPAARSRPWPRTWEWRKNESLLVLFFRKEQSFRGAEVRAVRRYRRWGLY